jgi:hypothetical protein
MDEAQVPKVSMLRILSRNALAGVRAFNIDAASKDLSVALVAMTLAVMRSIPHAKRERDDTAEEMLRGLMYLLFCFAAAGTEPSIWVFQLTQPHAALKMPDSTGKWWIYAEVLAVLGRMVLPSQTRADVVRSACRLLAHALRGYTDPVTAPLRKAAKALDLARSSESSEWRDKELQLARAVFLFLRAVDEPIVHACSGPAFFELPRLDIALHAPVAAKLLAAMMPPGHRLREYRRALRAIVSGESTHEPFRRAREAGAVYFGRYSGYFASAKRAVVSDHATGLPELERARQCAAQFLGVGVETVTVANYAAFSRLPERDEDAEEAHKAEVKRLGDAEMARLNWASGADEWCCGPTRGYGPLARRSWDAILSGAGVGLAGLEAAECAELEIAQTPEERVLVPAVRLAATLTLDAIVEVARIPLGPISRMLETLGLSALDARAVILIHFDCWRDVNESDRRATDYLVLVIGAKVEAAKVEAAKVEAAKVEAAKVEAAKVEAAKAEAAKAEAAKVEAAIGHPDSLD